MTKNSHHVGLPHEMPAEALEVFANASIPAEFDYLNALMDEEPIEQTEALEQPAPSAVAEAAALAEPAHQRLPLPGQ